MPDNDPAGMKDTASKSVDAGIADETAAYDEAMTPTEGNAAEDESEAQPS